MGTLRSWYAAGKWTFVARFAAVGVVAGVAAWLLALALHSFLGVGRPTILQLILAVPRGALFGVLLALALARYWDWKSDRRGGAR